MSVECYPFSDEDLNNTTSPQPNANQPKLVVRGEKSYFVISKSENMFVIGSDNRLAIVSSVDLTAINLLDDLQTGK